MQNPKENAVARWGSMHARKGKAPAVLSFPAASLYETLLLFTHLRRLPRKGHTWSTNPHKTLFTPCERFVFVRLFLCVAGRKKGKKVVMRIIKKKETNVSEKHSMCTSIPFFSLSFESVFLLSALSLLTYYFLLLLSLLSARACQRACVSGVRNERS